MWKQRCPKKSSCSSFRNQRSYWFESIWNLSNPLNQQCQSRFPKHHYPCPQTHLLISPRQAPHSLPRPAADRGRQWLIIPNMAEAPYGTTSTLSAKTHTWCATRSALWWSTEAPTPDIFLPPPSANIWRSTTQVSYMGKAGCCHLGEGRGWHQWEKWEGQRRHCL